jgi:hypothetical protein
MHVNALFRAKYLAVETGDTVLSEFQRRDQLPVLFFHVNNVSRTHGIANSAAGAFVQININYHDCLPSVEPI